MNKRQLSTSRRLFRRTRTSLKLASFKRRWKWLRTSSGSVFRSSATPPTRRRAQSFRKTSQRRLKCSGPTTMPSSRWPGRKPPSATTLTPSKPCIRPLPSTPKLSPPNNSRRPSSSRPLPTPNRPGSPPCSYFVFSFFARSVAGLHLSQQARLIQVNSLCDQLLRRFIEEVVRRQLHSDAVPLRPYPQVLAQMRAREHSLAHRTTRKVLLRFHFNVKVRQRRADRFVEGPQASHAPERHGKQHHVAKGASPRGKPLPRCVPIVRVFGGDVCGYNTTLTFGLLFRSHGWAPAPRVLLL